MRLLLSSLFTRLPPPPRRFTLENVQTRYFILTWNEPENASLYQIQKYPVERRTSRSENFILVKTVPYPDTQMILENLDPSTEYTGKDAEKGLGHNDYATTISITLSRY